MARIFVIEDEEEVFELIRMALECHGYSIRNSSDGREALTVLQKEDFDLVILDVMMPGIDGYSILGELEKSPQKMSMPFIVISALKPAEKLFNKFKNVKCFLAKPFEAEVLLQKVNEIIHP